MSALKSSNAALLKEFKVSFCINIHVDESMGGIPADDCGTKVAANKKIRKSNSKLASKDTNDLFDITISLQLCFVSF